VIVNEAGNWIGKLIGFGDSNMAGSEEIDFVVGADGQVYVSNSDNAAGSTNNAQANVTDTTNVNQENNAVIENNINLSANTGGNTSSFNTGGDSTIVTGDANIIANIVNFVNNNIVGAGNLFVTVINVFGSWVGDFVGPGQTKAIAEINAGIGGNPANYEDHSDNQVDNPSQVATAETQGFVSENTASPGILKASTSKLTGLFAGNKVGSDDPESLAEAPGVNAIETAADKVMNINLAYLLLLVPVCAFYLVAKKYSYLLLPKKAGNG
jgi:hypothetical protein